MSETTDRKRSPLGIIDTTGGNPVCVVCGYEIGPGQKIRSCHSHTSSSHTAIVHARCVGVVERTNRLAASAVMLEAFTDSEEPMWVLPDDVPENAPIFWNGMLQLDGDDYVRFGRSIVFIGGRTPSQGCSVVALLGGAAASPRQPTSSRVSDD